MFVSDGQGSNGAISTSSLCSGSMAYLPHSLMCRAGLCSPKAEDLYAPRHYGRDLFAVGLEAL